MTAHATHIVIARSWYIAWLDLRKKYSNCCKKRPKYKKYHVNKSDWLRLLFMIDWNCDRVITSTSAFICSIVICTYDRSLIRGFFFTTHAWTDTVLCALASAAWKLVMELIYFQWLVGWQVSVIGDTRVHPWNVRLLQNGSYAAQSLDNVSWIAYVMQ